MENAENQAKWDTRHRKKTIKAHKKTQRRKLKEKQLATRTPPKHEYMVDRMGQNYVVTDYERPLLTKSYCTVSFTCRVCKKSLKIPKGQSESVCRRNIVTNNIVIRGHRRTDNTMAKRKSIKGQTTINKTYI